MILERLNKAIITAQRVFRSKGWSTLRDDFLAENGKCFICGSRSNLEVHHIKDVSNFPELELDENNLMTLCDGSDRFEGLSCHRIFGHFGCWRRTNYQLPEVAKIMRQGMMTDKLR